MRLLITGSSGQLGQQLVKTFKLTDTVLATSSQELNLLNKAQIHSVITAFAPDVIIHAAAWTNVDEAARHPEDAMQVNGLGTHLVAEAAKAVGSRLIYISTNEVFSGDKEQMYSETDVPDPINAYGRSKLAGEQAVRDVLDDDRWTIARVSWLYGATSTKNFPSKIIQLADSLDELKVVDDEISTPTFVPDVVEALDKILRQNVHGILHLVNEGYCSRYEWAKKTLELTGREQISIKPIKLRDFSRASTPPPHSVLVNTKAKSVGIALPDWQVSFTTYTKSLPHLQE